jgi:hypothetical protein
VCTGNILPFLVQRQPLLYTKLIPTLSILLTKTRYTQYLFILQNVHVVKLRNCIPNTLDINTLIYSWLYLRSILAYLPCMKTCKWSTLVI